MESIPLNITSTYVNKLKPTAINEQIQIIQKENSNSHKYLDNITSNNKESNIESTSKDTFRNKKNDIVSNNNETIQTYQYTITNPISSNRLYIQNNNTNNNVDYLEQIQIQQQHPLSIQTNSNNTFEMFSERLHITSQTIPQLKQFDITSTHKITEETFTLTPRVVNPLTITFTNPNEIVYSKQNFDIEILNENTIPNIYDINSYSIDNVVKNKKPPSKRKHKSKTKHTNKKSKSPLKTQRYCNNNNNNTKHNKMQIQNTFFKEVIFFSNLRKLIVNDYNIKTKDGVIYVNRFCALKQHQFEYYTSKEEFILLQKPKRLIQNECIKKVKEVSLFNILGKGYSKTKNHFMVRYIMKGEKSNLNVTQVNVKISETNGNENKIMDVVFTSDNEGITKQWVMFIKKIMLNKGV